MRAFLLLGFLARWGKEELYCSILSVRWEPKGRGALPLLQMLASQGVAWPNGYRANG
jgi:hypothetical protein